jgi:hypothetical protein
MCTVPINVVTRLMPKLIENPKAITVNLIKDGKRTASTHKTGGE